MIFGNEFDVADAAIYGGIIGFIEDSVKADHDIEQEEVDDPVDEAIDTYLEGKPDRQLQLLYNDNPGLVRHLIKKAYSVRSAAAEKIKEKEIEEIRKEMLEELREQEANES